ncbi:transposable element Tcb2 transposase [Trichonephila clavipes]|nr:transposable element Tcb2 transposase [Trichonephila clavipes]
MMSNGFRRERNSQNEGIQEHVPVGLQKFMRTFNPKEGDISYYLILFERQARRVHIKEEDWVTNLVGLLPLEMANLIAREPEEKANDYEHIKGGNWTAGEWIQVVFSDESRFNLSSDDNHVRLWRPRGERLNPAFALQQHTTPTAGVNVWGAIAYNTLSPLVLIRGTMMAQRYVHDILQPHVFPLVQWLPGAILQQDNARPHTGRVLQDCLCTVTTLSWPGRSPDLSPIEHIWDHLRRLVGHPTSLNELETRLQQIWYEMFQDIIQNLYASMPDRIASCIRARGGSTGY